jgi:hypothetical protein
MTAIPVPGRLGHEDSEFKASLDYIVRPCHKTKQNKQNETHSTQTWNPQWDLMKVTSAYTETYTHRHGKSYVNTHTLACTHTRTHTHRCT